MTREEMIEKTYQEMVAKCQGRALFGEPIDIDDPRQVAIAWFYLERLERLGLEGNIKALKENA